MALWPLYLFFALSGNMQWGIHLYMLPLLAGGLLHLVIWYKEKRADHMPQPSVGSLSHQGAVRRSVVVPSRFEHPWSIDP